MLGVQLLSYASHRRETMEVREAEDVVNDFGRDPIGEGKEERVRNNLITFMKKHNIGIYRRTTVNSKLFWIGSGTTLLLLLKWENASRAIMVGSAMESKEDPN